MSSKHVAVFGIYKTPATAEAAVDHLLSVGFANESISVLLPDDESTRAFAHEKATKAPEGTTTGVAAGGAVGETGEARPRLASAHWRFRESAR